MKPLLSFILFLGLLGCEIPELPIEETNQMINNSYCLDVISNKPSDHKISGADLDLSIKLFAKNHLPLTNFQITGFEYEPEYGKYHIDCNQFKNGYRFFSDDVIFHFNSDSILYFLTGKFIADSVVVQETTMNITKDQIAEIFGQKVNNFMGINYKESCFKGELGFYRAQKNQDYQFVWKVWYNNGIPVALIRPSDGSVIYYDNGIRIFTK